MSRSPDVDARMAIMKLSGNTVLITGGATGIGFVPMAGLERGDTEVGFGFTERMNRASGEELEQRFKAMNSW